MGGWGRAGKRMQVPLRGLLWHCHSWPAGPRWKEAWRVRKWPDRASLTPITLNLWAKPSDPYLRIFHNSFLSSQITSHMDKGYQRKIIKIIKTDNFCCWSRSCDQWVRPEIFLTCWDGSQCFFVSLRRAHKVLCLTLTTLGAPRDTPGSPDAWGWCPIRSCWPRQ